MVLATNCSNASTCTLSWGRFLALRLGFSANYILRSGAGTTIRAGRPSRAQTI
jgi:hypothetical protein